MGCKKNSFWVMSSSGDKRNNDHTRVGMLLYGRFLCLFISSTQLAGEVKCGVCLKRWCQMEVRVLRYFLTVAKEQSFIKAAKQLHIKQPTLSRQLSAFKEELGVTLFIRNRKRIYRKTWSFRKNAYFTRENGCQERTGKLVNNTFVFGKKLILWKNYKLKDSKEIYVKTNLSTVPLFLTTQKLVLLKPHQAHHKQPVISWFLLHQYSQLLWELR